MAVRSPATTGRTAGNPGSLPGAVAGVLIAGYWVLNRSNLDLAAPYQISPCCTRRGLIPALRPLYDYSWAVGFGAGLVSYLVLSMAVPNRRGGVRGRGHQSRTGPAAVDG